MHHFMAAYATQSGAARAKNIALLMGGDGDLGVWLKFRSIS